MDQKRGKCEEVKQSLSEDQEQKDQQLNIKPVISIKALQAKFMVYLNYLNFSSTGHLINKTLKINYRQQVSVQNLQNLAECNRFSYSLQSFQQNSQQQNLSKTKRTKSKRRNIGSRQKIEAKVSGKAIIQFKNGSVFKGILQNGEMTSGILQFPDGVSYEGEFKDSFFHGKGTFKLSNGTMFKAIFKEGKMGNKGEIIYNNGDIYKGQIFRCKKNGKGELIFMNNHKYVGEFLDGQITGSGIYYINQFPVAKGKWKNGEFLGKIFCLDNINQHFTRKA